MIRTKVYEQFPIQHNEEKLCKEKRTAIERMRKQYSDYLRKRIVNEQSKPNSRCETSKREV